MDKNISRSYLGIAVMLGSVWGLCEAGLGMWLRSCASMFSGAIMTGVALFFITTGWILTKRILGVALLVVLASFFKMFDALLLSLPVQHGAVANPIFAFLMEGMALLILVYVFREKLKKKIGGQALLGGMAALLAVNLFPLVKYATGIPACVFPGTAFPLSLYYAPLAVFLSSVTVPLGFLAGAKIKEFETKLETNQRLRYILSPATLIVCLVIIALIRLG